MSTINSYLSVLQSELYVNGDEREKIRKSIDTIFARLSLFFGNPDRNIHRIVRKEIFGSYSRDTMLSRKYDDDSDIDLMIIFQDSESYTPQTCLNWLKSFAEYWYSTSLIKQSLPTVVIELENIKFELVPAYEDKYGLLHIAKNSSEWQYTNPKELNEKMDDLNQKTNFKFKRMIRAIKYWNVKKNLRKYKSYMLEEYLEDKIKNIYYCCKNEIDYIDWAFYYLAQYPYNDSYVNDRISRIKSYIKDAKDCEENGKYDLAVEYIKKIFPDD